MRFEVYSWNRKKTEILLIFSEQVGAEVAVKAPVDSVKVENEETQK